MKTHNSLFGYEKELEQLKEDLKIKPLHQVSNLRASNLLRISQDTYLRRKVIEYFSQDLKIQRLKIQELFDRAEYFDKRVINAIGLLDRNIFLKPSQRELSYWNEANLISPYHTVSSLGIVCYIAQQINPKKGMKILEVGSGSNYNILFLDRMSSGLYLRGVEINDKFFNYGEKIFDSVNHINNIEVRCDDGNLGWRGEQFDVIYCTAGMTGQNVPEVWFEQITDQGRIIFPRALEYDDWLVLKKEGELNGYDSFKEYIQLPFHEKQAGFSIVTMDANGVELDKLVGVQFVPFSPTGKRNSEATLSKLEQSMLDVFHYAN